MRARVVSSESDCLQARLGDVGFVTPDIIVTLGRSSVQFPPGVRVIELSEDEARNTDALIRKLEIWVEPGKVVSLDVPAGMKDRNPETLTRLLGAIGRAKAHVQGGHNVSVLRGELVVRNVIANIAHLHRCGLANTNLKTLKGHTAFIVGAGPSLEKNALELQRMTPYGTVFSVNSNTNYLYHQWLQDDVCVCVESVDAGDQVYARPCERVMVTDVSAHPDNVLDRVFVAAQPAWWWVARELDIATVPYTGNVTAAAFSLAVTLGASRIVLVGQDLAYTDGYMYAGDDRIVTFDTERMRIYLPERPESDSRYRKVGLPAPGREERLEWVPGWGGGDRMAATTPALSMFRQWLERAAKSLAGKGIELVNATEGGAHIRGFRDAPLRDVLGLRRKASDPIRYRSVSEDQVSSLLASIAADATLAAGLADKAASASRLSVQLGFQRLVRQHLRNAPFVECYAIRRLHEAMSADVTTRKERHNLIYSAIRDSAAAVRRFAEEAKNG